MSAFLTALGEYFGTAGLRKIQQTKIGIAGCGGLGSNCAMNLVRCGFRVLTLCDFDRVEAKNLNRQFYFTDQIGSLKAEALRDNLLKISGSLECTLATDRLTGENIETVLKDCDVVVEAFDRAEDKRMMAQMYSRTEKFFVSASGLAGWGESDAIATKKMNDSFYLIGDLKTGVTPQTPPCAPRVAVAAAKQADCILTWVLEGAVR